MGKMNGRFLCIHIDRRKAIEKLGGEKEKK